MEKAINYEDCVGKFILVYPSMFNAEWLGPGMNLGAPHAEELTKVFVKGFTKKGHIILTSDNPDDGDVAEFYYRKERAPRIMEVLD